jgi:prolyl oligopeptidase
MRCLLVYVLCSAALTAAEARRYPESRSDQTVDILHGKRVPDPYRWLEDQKSAETRAWIDKQVAYTRSLLDPLPVRKPIADRLSELTRVDTALVPLVRSGIYFYRRKSASQNQSDIYMRRGADGAEKLLVDVNGMTPDGSKSASLIDASADGKLLAYGIRTGGRDEMVLRLMDVETGKPLPDDFPEARYSGFVFDPQGKGFYYALVTPKGPRLRHHRYGTAVSEDREVFGEGMGPQLYIHVAAQPEARHMVITIWFGSASKTDLYIKEIAGDAAPVPVVTGVDALFVGATSGNRLYIQTTWNAPKGRVMVADLARTGREHWREFVPEGKSNLERFVAAGRNLLAVYVDAAATRIDVFDPEGKRVREVPLPAKGTATSFQPSGDNDGDVCFLFVSFAYPARVYRYNSGSGKLETWYASRTPIRGEDFAVRQVWYESKDKTRIPMFLAHKKGLTEDGKRPVLLTGYGGFTVSLTPYFATGLVVWMEAGGVVAVPNLRGGGEFGEEWHRAGMLARKQNVFDDFLAAAEWLIANRYTKPSRLAISGYSNGGLLVGAAAIQRPELFQAVICGAPLLDMIRYHQFLVARWWVPEYGSSDDPAQFEFLLRYSPYHNVEHGAKYPAILFVTGDSDTRVHPLHARKMAARMQAATGSGRPILLHYDTSAGHAGGKPVDRQIADKADELAFLFSQLNVAYAR